MVICKLSVCDFRPGCDRFVPAAGLCFMPSCDFVSLLEDNKYLLFKDLRLCKLVIFVYVFVVDYLRTRFVLICTKTFVSTDF